MKRILHIVYAMDMGGIQSFIMNIYRHIDKNKIQFDFLVRVNRECYYDEEIKKLGGKIYYIPSRRTNMLHQSKIWKNFFIEHTEFSTIHYHTSSLSDINPIKFAKKSNIKQIIVHIHSTTTPKNIYHKVLHSIHKLIVDKYVTDMYACSEVAAEFAYKKSMLENVKIIKNGIEAKKYIFNTKIRTNKRKELNLQESDFVIGHVGRFDKIKNHTFIIDIYKEILEKDKNAILVLIGKEDERKEIRLKIKNLNMESKVRILGIRDDVNELLMAMDIFIFPSFKEGLPVSVIEAQCTGLKCFLSDTITKEVDLTGNVEFISLDKSAKYWAENILKYKKYDRKDSYKEVVNAGYDINSTIKELEEKYV